MVVEYVLTKHAKDIIKERNIELSWLEMVINDPELVEPDSIDHDLEHRLGRIECYGNRALRVVLNIKKSPVEVVTVYFDRTMRNKL